MKLSDVSISRPVFATVMSLMIVLIGLVSYQKLSVREYPRIDEPAVTVNTTYPGASAEIIESQITKNIEDSLSGIEGIKTLSSVSREGTSSISVVFIQSRDPDDAASDVRDKVSRVRGLLPDEIDEPIINKVEADSSPIIWLVLQSNELTPAQLTDLAERYLKDQLQTIPGVADVSIFGAREYAMRIWLDPVKLAAHQLTTQDVETAVAAQNVDIPSGRVEGSQREFTVLTTTDLQTVDQFQNIIIANRDGHPIKIKDVGRASLGVVDDRVSFRFNGQQSIGLGIVKQAVANPIDISNAVRKLLPSLQQNLPKAVELELGYDSSVFIQASIDNVYHTLAEAVLLVVLVIFLFLHSARATLVPLVTIPVSLIGAFAIMAAMGFTINTLTMLALVLAIGLVVDDAIVMLENIYRHIEEGMHPFKAAMVGAKEISFAVLAMTITLAAVYVPVAFMEGRTGKLFTEFALTLAGAVLISGFVALTLSPMMCSLILKHDAKPGKFAKTAEGILHWLDDKYRNGARRVLKVRMLVFPILIIVGVAIGFLFMTSRSELSPTEDRGVVFTFMQGPEGATVDYMTAYALQLEEAAKTIPEINRIGLVTGIGGGRLPVASQGLGFLRTKDWDERKTNTQAIAGMLFPKFMEIPGILAFPIVPASLGASGFAKPIEFVIKDSSSYQSLGANTAKFLAKISENKNLIGLDTDLKMNTPQLSVSLDRDRMADLGISVAELGRTLETFLASRQVTRFKKAGEQYDVILQTENDLRAQPDQLNQIYVRTKTGEMVPISSVVKIQETVAPRDLNHFNRMRAVKITSNLAPGYSLGDALKYMQQVAKEVLPPTAQVDYDGQTREFLESSSGLYFALLLALGFIFLVLAAQFESFIDPIIIMITVPLTMFGALAALRLTGNTLNIYSQIGLITLVGLITKHGILIVEFANKQQEKGLNKFDAVIEAAVLRLRPILMTTGAMVLGAVPLAIASGAGAESRQVIGWTIVGGMSVGTLLTLFVLPAVYTFIARDHSKVPDYKKEYELEQQKV